MALVSAAGRRIKIISRYTCTFECTDIDAMVAAHARLTCLSCTFFSHARLRRPRAFLTFVCSFFFLPYQGMYLKSDSKVIELRAHGGWLSLLNTEVSVA